jgi:hypothetical protein
VCEPCIIEMPRTPGRARAFDDSTRTCQSNSASQNRSWRYAKRHNGAPAIRSLMEEYKMKSIARMAALLTTVLLVSGCTGSMRHDRQMKDQVRLPTAPTLETSPTTGPTSPASPTSPYMGVPSGAGGQSALPPSSSASQRPVGPN